MYIYIYTHPPIQSDSCRLPFPRLAARKVALGARHAELCLVELRLGTGRVMSSDGRVMSSENI